MGKTFQDDCRASLLCKLALIAFLLFPAMNVLQAGTLSAKTVTGTVVSAIDHEPLIGATVQVLGTQTGTVTDLDGAFSVEVNDDQTLVFSYVGYVTQRIKVGSKTNINIALEEDNQSLEDVVVIGYGVQKKKLVTGATTQLKGDDVAKLNTNNALQAMQGQTPGVNIISENGQPGAGMKVIIRGQGSNISNSPLYVVDGVSGVDINKINPADIESIDVLKDAASTAIYGAAGANGVILVTTKSGKEGKAQVSFDAYWGWQSATRKVKMLNADQYMTLMDEQSLNSGGAPYDWSKYPIYDANGNVNNTNWMSEMFKNGAPQSNYNLGITGGGKQTTYAVSLGYLDQEGIVGGKNASNYGRYNFRGNFTQKLYGDLLKIGENISFSYINQRGIGSGNMYNNALRPAFGTTPLLPVYLQPDGRPDLNNGYSYSTATDWYQYDTNPVAAMYRSHNKTHAQNWVANVFADIQPIKNLIFHTQLAFKHNTSDYRSYRPAYTATTNDGYSNNEVQQSTYNGWSLEWINTLTYQFSLAKNNFTVMVGTDASRNQGVNLNGSGTLNKLLDSWATAYLDNTETRNGAYRGYPDDEYKTMSYLGRISWDYDGTYMATFSLRNDGDSRFAKGHQHKTFPAVSAGWIITNEKFMKPVLPVMDYLKIRASWGQNGNATAPAYQWAAQILATGAGYNFGTGKGTSLNTNGAYPYNLANEDLGWETSEQTDLGIDARFFRSRLNLNFDYYWKKTKDWVVQAPVIATSGAEAPYINGGDVNNNGFELALNWNDNIGKDFRYNIGANMAYNKNKVKNLKTADGIIHGSTNIMFNNQREFYRISENHAMGYFWGYKTDGLFQTQEDIDNWVAAGNGIKSGTKPGDVRFVDLNHDGQINDDDKVDLGNGIPKWNFGFTAGFTYKNFDFNMVWSGMAGFKVANGGYRNWGNADQSNYTTRFLDRWTGPGTSNSIPRLVNGDISWTDFSELYLESGNFIRLANVTLGYDFAPLLRAKFLSQLRLYFQAQNLFTLTNYSGMDPEVGFGQDAWMNGIDTGVYPHARTFLFGVNVKF